MTLKTVGTLSQSMRSLTPAQHPDTVPDWVISEWFEEYEKDRDTRAEANIRQAFNLRDRCPRGLDDEGEDGMEIVAQIRHLLSDAGDLGIVARSMLRPLVTALDPAVRMMKAAQVEASKLEAERLGVGDL
jgi:hypothetical protein